MFDNILSSVLLFGYQLSCVFLILFTSSFCASLAWLCFFHKRYDKLQSTHQLFFVNRLQVITKVLGTSVVASLLSTLSAPFVAIWLIHKTASSTVKANKNKPNQAIITNPMSEESVLKLTKNLVTLATNPNQAGNIDHLVSSFFGSAFDAAENFKVGLNVRNEECIDIAVRISGPISKAILAITKLETGTMIQSRLE